jgi:hypothetical protein
MLSMDIYEPPRDESLDETKDDLAIKPTQTLNHDVVFGVITEEGPNYRNVHINRSKEAFAPS